MKKGFEDYVVEHIKDYLPDDYADAVVSLEEITKTNDRELTGLVIRKPDEVIAPTIYLEPYYLSVAKEGRAIPLVVKDIARSYLSSGRDFEFDLGNVTDYEKAKPRLEIVLCDPEINGKYLEGKAYTSCGAFAALYRIQILNTDESACSAAITTDLMGLWGISLDELHRDAVAAEIEREPAFLYDMDDMFQELCGHSGRNLLEDPEYPDEKCGMFTLTNASKVNGASVIARDGIMDRIGDFFENDYFILPSSIHELLLLPDNGQFDWDSLSQMVNEVNNTQVATEDLLSYKVQRYDRETKVLQLAPDMAKAAV